MKCQGPECDREAEFKGLCSAHYQQGHRGNDLKPLRADDNTEQVTFRCSPELKRDAEKAAKRAGIAPGEWWRRAGEKGLKK